MSDERKEKRCPHLEEVVMLCCTAYPIKKMVPRSRITTATRCFEGCFEACPLYQEVAARVRSLAEQGGGALPEGRAVPKGRHP